MISNIEKICPWSYFKSASFPVCEVGICSWIREPANTFSNISFFIVSGFLIRRFLNDKNRVDFGVGFCSLLIAFSSSLAHASATEFFGFFDFAAIFSILSLVLAYNISDHFKKIQFSILKIFLAAFGLSVAFIFFFYEFSVSLLLLIGAGLLVWEIRNIGENVNTKNLYRIGGLFLIGGVSLIFDSTKTYCNAENHFFQLHMIWHFCMALSLYFLAEHLKTKYCLKQT